MLTTAGAAYLASSLDNLNLGAITVEATLPDSKVLTRTFTPAVTDANTGSTYNTATWANVATLSDKYEDGGQGNNAGYTITALGDVTAMFSDAAFSNNTTNVARITAISPGGGELTDMPIASLGGAFRSSKATPNSDYSNRTLPGSVISMVTGSITLSGKATTPRAHGHCFDRQRRQRFPEHISDILADIHLAGSSVSGVGDIDNDGHADFLFGMPVSRAYLVHGNNLGWGANGTDTPPIPE